MVGIYINTNCIQHPAVKEIEETLETVKKRRIHFRKAAFLNSYF